MALYFLHPVQEFPHGDAGTAIVTGILVQVIFAGFTVEPGIDAYYEPKRSARRPINSGAASAGELMEILLAPKKEDLAGVLCVLILPATQKGISITSAT